MAKRRSLNRREREDTLIRIYEELYDRVTWYIYARVGSQHDAEDLASETFVRALHSLDTYEDRGLPMEAWVFRIAHNLVVDYFRKEKKRVSVPLDEAPVRNSTDPEEDALKNIEIEGLMQALNQLPDSHREIISLRFFSGLSSIECGQIVNKKPGAVREMQRIAVIELRQALDKEARHE